MQDEMNGVVIDRLYEALGRGDVAGAMECVTPDARTWHNFDNIVQEHDEIRAVWAGFVEAFPERSFQNAARSAIPGGFVQQHVMVGRNAAGERLFWPICIVVQVRDGLISRLDEYVAPSGSFPVVDTQDAQDSHLFAVQDKAGRPVPTADRTRALADLAEHGVCIITDAMSPEFHREVDDALTRASISDNQRQWRRAYEFGEDDPNSQRIWNLPSRDPVFCDLAEHELALFFLKATIGWPAMLSSMSANITTGGGQSMVVHCDQGYMPTPWDGVLGINTAWCVDDFTAENGATCYLPGSHLLGRNKRAGDDVRNMVPLEAPAGSLIVMDGRIWHTNGVNNSNQRRAGIFSWYTMPIYMPQENWFLSVNPAVRQFGSETLLTLLGFRPQLMGRVNGLERL